MWGEGASGKGGGRGDSSETGRWELGAAPLRPRLGRPKQGAQKRRVPKRDAQVPSGTEGPDRASSAAIGTPPTYRGGREVKGLGMAAGPPPLAPSSLEPQLHTTTWNEAYTPKTEGRACKWVKARGTTHCACPRDTAAQRPRAEQEEQRRRWTLGTLRPGGSGKRGAGPEPGSRHVPRRDTWRRICSEPTWRRGGGGGAGRAGAGSRGWGGEGRRGGGCGGGGGAATGGCGRRGGRGTAPAQCGGASRRRGGAGSPSRPSACPAPAAPGGLAPPRLLPLHTETLPASTSLCSGSRAPSPTSPRTPAVARPPARHAALSGRGEGTRTYRTGGPPRGLQGLPQAPSPAPPRSFLRTASGRRRLSHPNRWASPHLTARGCFARGPGPQSLVCPQTDLRLKPSLSKSYLSLHPPTDLEINASITLALM